MAGATGSVCLAKHTVTVVNWFYMAVLKNLNRQNISPLDSSRFALRPLCFFVPLSEPK